MGADHGYEISKIPDDPKKRLVFAQLCRKDRDNPLTVAELRQMVKEPLEALASKDSRVERVRMQVEADRRKWLLKMVSTNDWVKALTGDREDSLTEWVVRRHIDIRELETKMSRLQTVAKCKRDNCTHYDGDICSQWTVESKIPDTILRKVPGREAWMFRVRHHPEICAACHKYVECGEKNRKLKESPLTKEDLDEVYKPHY